MSFSSKPVTGVRAKRSVAALPAIVLAFGAGTGVAGAQSDAGKPVVTDPDPFSYITPADREKMRAQAPLLEAARPIRDAAEKDAEAHGASGFTSVELGDGSVVVRWKGALPQTVSKAVDDARKVVRVDVADAKHSRHQLQAAADRVQKSLVDDPGKPAFSVSVPSDGSGLLVDTEGDVEKTKKQVPAVGVPVRVQPGQVFRAGSRLDDIEPFWGGARIVNPETNAGCTAGFAVTDGWREYLLTAGHCGRVGGRILNGSGRLPIGTASHEHVNYDIMLIPTNGEARIYDGGVGSGEFSKGVVGFDHVYPGEWLCVSGSVTGAVCGVQVTYNFPKSYCTTDMYGNYECRTDLFEAIQRNGSTAMTNGDSGGPVFNLSGHLNVVAKGTMVGFSGTGSRFVFQDFVTTNRTFNVRPL